MTKTFHGAGLVVPVDKNDVGYRELPETDGNVFLMDTCVYVHIYGNIWRKAFLLWNSRCIHVPFVGQSLDLSDKEQAPVLGLVRPEVKLGLYLCNLEQII